MVFSPLYTETIIGAWHAAHSTRRFRPPMCERCFPRCWTSRRSWCCKVQFPSLKLVQEPRKPNSNHTLIQQVGTLRPLKQAGSSAGLHAPYPGHNCPDWHGLALQLFLPRRFSPLRTALWRHVRRVPASVQSSILVHEPHVECEQAI